jgi:hypothetical protein
VRSAGPHAEIVAIADLAQIAAISVDNRPHGASPAGSTRDQLTPERAGDVRCHDD